jgi:hypothetical protein
MNFFENAAFIILTSFNLKSKQNYLLCNKKYYRRLLIIPEKVTAVFKKSLVLIYNNYKPYSTMYSIVNEREYVNFDEKNIIVLGLLDIKIDIRFPEFRIFLFGKLENADDEGRDGNSELNGRNPLVKLKCKIISFRKNSVFRLYR